jgi:hydroxyacyl-ACP dehydratase HTD2-like protein with hotdog domain
VTVLQQSLQDPQVVQRFDDLGTHSWWSSPAPPPRRCRIISWPLEPTFNDHRIHFDQPYTTKVEGYLGLIVHGPPLTTLLIDLPRRERPDATAKTFAFRTVGPLFDTGEFAVCGAPTDDGESVTLWARTMDGLLAMKANASVA